jgi:protein-disulfide isomerase
MSLSLSRSAVLAAALTLTLAACDKAKDATPAADASASPAAAAPGGQDWTKTVSITDKGGISIGNPDAPVKLIEYASFTCPHCREFKEQGLPTLLRDYVGTGKVHYEFRSFLLNGIDIGPSLLVMCQQPAAAWKLTEALYSTQMQWVQGYQSISEADQAKLQAMPADKAIAAIADAGGLDDFARLRGIPSAKFQQCLSDQGNLGKLQANVQEAVSKYKLTGTPTFVINDETAPDTYTWAALEPKLKAAVQ